MHPESYPKHVCCRPIRHLGRVIPSHCMQLQLFEPQPQLSSLRHAHSIPG